MAYDVFDTYRKRLTESASSRFKDVGVQTPQRVETMSREEMFDNAFSNVYGIKLEESAALHEDFGTFPDWLKKFLSKNKNVKLRLTKMGVDLSRATFISGQLPRSARDPAFKDPTRVAVFRMVDRVGEDHEVIYIPGVTDPTVYPDENNRWARYSASTVSKKKLLELTKEYGYIDMNDSRNSNRALRKERSDAKSGMVVRNRAAGLSPQKTNVQYATDERGRTNWDEVISYDIKWVTQRGFDASGYPLDPDKYGRMLDNVGLEDYATRLEMLYNKIESARERLIAVMSKYTVKDSTKVKVRNTWGRNIFGDVARIAQDFSNAIDAYQELQDSVQQIIDATGLEDTEKNERIAYVFKWNGKRVREYLKDVTSALKSAETAEQL